LAVDTPSMRIVPVVLEMPRSKAVRSVDLPLCLWKIMVSRKGQHLERGDEPSCSPADDYGLAGLNCEVYVFEHWDFVALRN